MCYGKDQFLELSVFVEQKRNKVGAGTIFEVTSTRINCIETNFHSVPDETKDLKFIKIQRNMRYWTKKYEILDKEVKIRVIAPRGGMLFQILF